MPGMDGITATRQLRGCKILVLTTFGTDDHVAQALRAGASGFLLKDATPEQLIHAIRSSPAVRRCSTPLLPATSSGECCRH